MGISSNASAYATLTLGSKKNITNIKQAAVAAIRGNIFVFFMWIFLSGSAARVSSILFLTESGISVFYSEAMLFIYLSKSFID